MRFRLSESLTPSTKSTYSAGARAFANLAITFNRLDPQGNLLPASTETIMLFMAYLSHTHRPGSIKTYLQVVHHIHLQHGHTNSLTDSAGIQRLKRVYGTPANARLPITPHLLTRFFANLILTHHDHLLIWAALLVAFFGFLRSS